MNVYSDLVAWGEATETLDPAQAQALLARAEREPEQAAAVLEGAIRLREAIYHIFSSVAAGRSPDPGDMDILNAALPEALSHLRLVEHADGFGWEWIGSGNALNPMLWPVARSAADWLTSDDLDRVRECADDRGCGFLFVDRSRNRSRRWCSMESCGNRAKVMRYLERKGD